MQSQHRLVLRSMNKAIHIAFYNYYTTGVERIYFGYVDITTGSVLTYKESESGLTVFPGKKTLRTQNTIAVSNHAYCDFCDVNNLYVYCLQWRQLDALGERNMCTM